MTNESLIEEIHTAVTEATGRYLVARRERVRPFTQRHFSFKGAARLNRRALGKDLLRTPANVAWVTPYLVSRGGAAVGRKLGLTRMANYLERLPPGFKTDVEREVEWLIYSELLELPFEQGERRCTRDALFEEILSQPAVNRLLSAELLKLDDLAHHQGFRKNLEDYLRTYTGSRIVAADLSGTLLNLAAGAAAFQKFTPGAMSMGSATATALAQHLAVSNFALGSTLGSLYYSAFPVAASTGLLVTTTGGLIVALGILTACTGIITDPIQQALGLHERKLLRLIDALEGKLKGEGKGLKIHDAYVARVFDLWDLLHTATRTLR